MLVPGPGEGLVDAAPALDAPSVALLGLDAASIPIHYYRGRTCVPSVVSGDGHVFRATHCGPASLRSCSQKTAPASKWVTACDAWRATEWCEGVPRLKGLEADGMLISKVVCR